MDSLESIAATPAAKTAYIQSAIRAASVELRKDYPILQKQSAIGAGILCFALLGMTVSAVLYINQVIPWWVCILANAFFASLTHELEHDLIHYMYFRKNRIVHNLMLGLAWLARRRRSTRGFDASTISITISFRALRLIWRSVRCPMARRGAFCDFS